MKAMPSPSTARSGSAQATSSDLRNPTWSATIPDRMVGVDIFGILVVGICAIISIQTEKSFILDIGVAWIILSFIGTLTLAKYLTGKKLNE